MKKYNLFTMSFWGRLGVFLPPLVVLWLLVLWALEEGGGI